MNIQDFEPDIEAKILKRGQGYYEDGLIDELWSPESNHYQAVVDGSEPYEVEVVLNADGEIIDHTCACPYDWGEHCKHMVAVLLAIRECRANGTTLPDRRQKKKRGLAARLEECSKKELIALLVSLSREHGLYQDIQYYFEDEEWDD